MGQKNMSWQTEIKEFGVRKTGSGILVHRGLNNGNGFEQERVHPGIRKEKTAFAVVLL